MNLAVPAAAAVEVELDVFSGRPNPRWRLDAGAAAQLLALLRTLPVAPGGAAGDRGLGFRGFIVDVAGEGRRLRLHVGFGRVEADGDSGDDAGGRIEALLRATMPAEVKAQFGSVLPP